MSYETIKEFDNEIMSERCSVKDLINALRECDTVTLFDREISGLYVHTDDLTGKKQLQIETEPERFNCCY